MEHFAGNCTSLCDDPNITTDLKIACDTGSYNYCAKDAEANIANPGCKTYLNRVVGNYTAERLGKVYSNPVKFPVGSTVQISNYYNDLGTAVTKYGTKDIGRLIGQSTSDLVKILRDNNPNYYTESTTDQLYNAAVAHCVGPNANATFCSESNPSWAVSAMASRMNNLIADLTAKAATGSIITAYNAPTYATAQSMHKKYPTMFKPVETLILSKLTKADLTNPFLATLRSYSPNMQTGVDTFVINLISGTKSSFTKERLDAAYSINLVNNTMLYDPDIQAYLSNINKYRIANNITSADPLITLTATTDSGNVQLCTTSNPLTTPICTKMNSTTTSTLATSIADATKTYCSSHVNDPACVQYINTNQTIFNTADVNSKMLNYCMTEGIGDTINCKPFSSINGSADWLKKNINNVKAADGTISAVCGTANGLTKDMCQKVCTTYPSLCAADAQQKCSMPTNRYSANIDYFNGKENIDNKIETTVTTGIAVGEENMDDDGSGMMWVGVIIFVLLFVGFLVGNRKNIVDWWDELMLSWSMGDYYARVDARAEAEFANSN